VTAQIERACQERAFDVAQQERLREALWRHQEDMLGLVGRLREAVHVPDLGSWSDYVDFGLEPLLEQEQLIRVSEVSLNALVVVVRDEGGPRAVKLTEEDTRLWNALRQHLGNKDPLWRDVAGWRQALLEEIKARARLNQATGEKAKQVFRHPVLLDSVEQEPRLTQALPPFVRAEVTGHHLGQPLVNLQDRLRVQHCRLEDPQSGRYLAEHLHPEAAEKAIENLRGLMELMVNTDEVRQAAGTYRELESRTTKVRTALEEYQLLHYIRGTCSLCKKLGGQ